ncbi:MAG TPA: hypothetical protein VLL08_28050 [Kineosporiaceae bacterium]|nr:hypothetical protein [Kineosporiaceae bacterium]
MTFPSANTPDVEETVQRLKELSNQAIEAGKQNGRTWLDAYEQLLNSYLKLQKQAAEGTQLEWVSTLANTNADFVREMSQVYLTTVREQLK